MSKFFRHSSGVKVMFGTTAFDLHLDGKKKELDKHMADCDATWRKTEGRTPVKDLTEREQMLEGRIPWDPVRLKELTNFPN